MTMPRTRALQIAELTGIGAVRPADVPVTASDTDVVIDVRAAAVSFPDVLQSRALYQYKPVPLGVIEQKAVNGSQAGTFRPRRAPPPTDSRP